MEIMSSNYNMYIRFVRKKSLMQIVCYSNANLYIGTFKKPCFSFIIGLF